MTGMGETLTQQDLIAARVKLIEGQIEGFKVSIQNYNCNHSALYIYIYVHYDTYVQYMALAVLIH